MFMAQQFVGQFRRKRLLIALSIATVVLILTLAFRYIEEKSRIEQQAMDFADKAIMRFDRMFSPLEVSASNTLGLVGAPCQDVRFPLIEKISSLQTVRAILLVENDMLYCSSIYGPRNIPFSQTYPDLAFNSQRMTLATDEYLLKGSPILLLWTPKSLDNRSGILQVINIEMMSNYLLEPQLPWVERAVFNVNGESLEYGNPLIEPTVPSDDEVSYEQGSLRYPFTLTLYGPSPTRLALATLPSQLPLALLLSLLMGYIIWLATANRMSLSWQISYGITAREFMVYCQPLINSKSGECDGIELLLRWHNARQGWITPDVFIPLAERQNLIKPLTRFVLNEVVRQLPQLPDDSAFHIAINVAASHFRDRAILEDLQNLWWPASPVPQLVVELTERDALPVVDQSVIAQLHEIGVRLAIDDFGTGHSSLSYLKDLQPDVLKIDKIFTAAIGTDAINATVTDMVISLAQRLNISLVAEGVETAEQADYLRERGVDHLQGYYFARPMPLEDFPAWLTRHQADARR
ncbi:EAL domain-containing protein [Pantoea sp. Bo_2]|uniref:cyclic-guanylate-specific phosphodiesterase n=1 Tax=Candidatus Pantoea gossypiicola TaxID=2608008 RepID=A0AB34CEV0_9GAMM|nr:MULTISPECIES: cyclic diguanylate phosphodiesterase [Pantoea]KAA5923972.1 EAL domain-containing protein [Pantoea sp. VH_8]KAA5930475.1 EAL domain-containing protein [Pantoea sp. VH_4]KAA5940469.1 EAL domain-containing protein [Pantoea sp. VH_3]KAA5949615.1 EAL domain-containing protein [Pantoea sp. VH_25]KAA5955343.1 EAL domain-containing protein [Pantoea sp. VH_24]